METFTFLFTDIEGSTALVRRLGEGLYAQVLADHHTLIRSGLAAHDGTEVDTHPHPDLLPARPPMALKSLLHLQHRRHARSRRGEHREERIPLRVHLAAVVRG